MGTIDDEVVRGSVVRKRKYPRQISLAVRSITTGLHLVMIDRSNPDLALPLEGCFVGSRVEVRLEAVNRGGTTAKLSTEADHNDNDNDNDNNSTKNQHRSAKGLTLLRSSPDPNAIQTCLKLVAENKLPLAVFSWGGDSNDGTANGDSVAGNHFNDESNDESNSTESETKNQRWLLLRDTEHALSILEKNPRDAFRRAAVKHLSRGLGGEGRWEDYCLVGVGVDNSGGEAAAVVGSLSGSVPALKPRRRPSHIKRRHRTTLERLEVSQAPLAAIERDGDRHGEDSGSVAAVVVAAAATVPQHDGNSNSNVDVVVESKAAPATRLPMPMPLSAAYNLPDPHDPRSMSGRHPKTRREYLRDKKWPQLDWLVKRLGPILETLRKKHEGSEPRFRRRRRRIEILDVGGGRGDIAVAVAEAFDDVRVTVVDVNESSLVGGRAYYESRKQWWTNTSGKIHGESQNEDEDEDEDDRVVFVCDDFADYAKSVERFDVVLAWHACGDLSDLALECSLERSGAFVICPCCYTKRHVRGFTPSWIGNYCRVVPSSLSTSMSTLTSSSSAIAVAVVASPADPATGSDPAEEKKEEPPETATPDGTCTIAAIPQTMPKKAPPTKTLPKPPSEQQQQQRAQEIATIQRLAEINERPEMTHRAMKLINTMRIRSLLALSSKTCESTAGGESASTIASTNASASTSASTNASATDGDCPNKDAILVENSRFSITLEEYDIAYSSKNLVLVGVRK
mmetsp:Transcript_3404/g.9531  ORF Transcript_3404/g.9531 Transcript_3404/m.9531 type:complete len:738 (-) Transcript_3404:2620-4833(-)